MPSTHSVNRFKEGVKRDAEELVLKKFPKKVLELESLQKDEKYCLLSVGVKTQLNIPLFDDTFEGQSPKKKSKLSEETKECHTKDESQNHLTVGLITENKYLEEMVSMIRPLVLEFTDDVLSLKIGIGLMIPKIEDGNNFGVEVQKEILENICAFEEEMYNRLNAINSYYTVRADLVSKLIKRPSIEDYRKAIEERDQMFYTFLCVTLTLVRNYYSILHDLVHKNLNRIKRPKSGSSEQMIY